LSIKAAIKKHAPPRLWEFAHSARWLARSARWKCVGAYYRMYTLLEQRLLNYNELHARRAWALANKHAQRVLVIGANDGSECRIFLGLGAGEVHGLDIDEGIGRAFSDRRVTYHRRRIEESGLPSNYFDLVFSTATMEHVENIEAAFGEMVRVTRPDGAIFSLASPLWNSPYGHHMGCFHGHPWVHLVFSRDQIVAYAREHLRLRGDQIIAIAHEHGFAGDSLEDIVDFMLDPRVFNKRPAKDYITAVDSLAGITVEQNHLDITDERLLRHPLGQAALELGNAPGELLATTHTFKALKP
jgi:SAM-dependent methyltransferase